MNLLDERLKIEKKKIERYQNYSNKRYLAISYAVQELGKPLLSQSNQKKLFLTTYVFGVGVRQE